MNRGPLTDTLLDDRYLVGPVVGSGGFGVVYEATHVGLASKVALKVPRLEGLPPSAASGAIARFLEEGRTLKLLRHPNLVAALDVGLLPPDADGLAVPYLVLEWCDGPTLKEWRAAHPGRMQPAAAWRALRPVFEAVAHAHHAGVVHRDLKPANVIMETTDEGDTIPRVIDFGIAKVLDPAAEPALASGETSTASALRAFTPKYAAPEQLAGLRTGPRADVYTLALLLLETIAGAPVFTSDEAARRAVIDDDPPTPSKLGLDLGAWGPILERALAPAPARRHADAHALTTALDAAIPPLEVAPPPSTGSRDRTRDAREVDAHRAPIGADESVVPSSHTLGTRGKTTTRSMAARVSRRGGVAGAMGAAVLALLLGAGIRAWWTRIDGSVPAASSVPASGSSSPTTPARPLRALDAPSLLARATQAGLTACETTEPLPTTRLLRCADGMAQLEERDAHAQRDPAWLRHELQYVAKSMGAGGRAARFTTDGAVGLVVAAPPKVVDRVFRDIVAGHAHGPVGTETPPPLQVKIPARLADWSGVELIARAEALGFDVTGVSLVPPVSAVSFIHGDAPGTLMLVTGEPSPWLTSVGKTARHYAYATDGDVTLIASGEARAGDVATIERLLDRSSAASIRFGK